MNTTPTNAQVYQWLSGVTDPEVPVLTILDLGIVRGVDLTPGPSPWRERGDILPGASKQNEDFGESGLYPSGDGGVSVAVTITPTYSGCPAMDAIALGIRMALSGRGFSKVTIEMQLSPAWTTDWMTEDGKRKLREYGIAPPHYSSTRKLDLFEDDEVPCPRCLSTDTMLVSNFGATSCKAAYQCNSCHEPFEHFKCH